MTAEQNRHGNEGQNDVFKATNELSKVPLLVTGKSKSGSREDGQEKTKTE